MSVSAASKDFSLIIAGCLYILLMMIPSTSGITLTGSSATVLLDQSFRFTCIVTGPSTSNVLFFQRNFRDFCTVTLNPCQRFGPPAVYSCSCGQSGVYHMDITSVSAADDGTWTCTRSQTSNNVTLTVYYGPFNNVTVDKASPIAVIEDVTVSLTARCSAVCNPDCSYTWSKGTQQVSDNRDLPVGSFRRGQEGEYRCTARNTATGTTADSQTLTVNVQYLDKPNIILDKNDVNENDTVNITCTVESNPPAKMTIDVNGRQETQTASNNLKRSTVKVWCSHNGTVTCKAENNQNTDVSSSTAQLNVKCPPREDLSMSRTSVVPGKLMTFVSLTAYVIANPLPMFTWYKHSTEPVHNERDSLIDSSGLHSTLKVLTKSEEDFTNYSVVVENNIGTTSLFFRLTKEVVSVSPLEASCNIVPVAAGEGAVIVILILIVIVLVILYRRRLCQGTGLPERNIHDGDGKTIMGLKRGAVGEESSEHGRAVDGPLTAETDTYFNAYCGVYEMEADKQTYTELKELETTNGSSTQGNATYEGLQARAPQVYEDMRK